MTILFDNITHRYGNNAVLENLRLEAKAGDITCLFGGSGCGKSTLLRIAAGIERLQHGSITLDGELMVTPEKQPPPEKRPVGIMFQENALFPHMTIGENIMFGLVDHPMPEKKRIAEEWLDNIGLTGFGQRYPHTLSGGQIQRVALARSLAPKPQVLLMDEPYASIDNVLRRQLREAARKVLKLTESVVIFVTHDPIEALEMADVIAVLDSGRIIQCANPKTLYQQPATKNVACLFGEAMQVSANQTTTGFDSPYGFIKYSSPSEDTGERRCELVIRPDGLLATPCETANLLVSDIRFTGNRWLLYLLPADAPTDLQPLRVAASNVDHLSLGSKVSLEIADKEIFVFS